MSEVSIMRTLRGHLTPQQIAGMSVVFDSVNRRRWSARVELINGADRWFKGSGKTFTEEVWRKDEDPHRQIGLP